MLKHIATRLLDIAYDEQGDADEKEYRMWYQYYLHGERGRAGLAENRREKRFTGRHQNRVVPNAGHNLPQEAPAAFADAVLDVNAWAMP